MQAYEAAMQLQPSSDLARSNRDKLPISKAYRAGAAYESHVLASRAARAALAAHAQRKAAGAKGGGWRRRPSQAAASAAGEAPLLSVMLHRTVRYLRRLETEQVPGAAAALWGARGAEMASTLAQQAREMGGGAPSSAASTTQGFTLGAFAWGGVWYQTLAAAFTASPECRAAILAASAEGGGGKPGGRRGGGAAAAAPAAAAGDAPAIVVLGSSIGFEVYFAALTFGVPAVGVELLSGLVSLSAAVQVGLRRIATLALTPAPSPAPQPSAPAHARCCCALRLCRGRKGCRRPSRASSAPTRSRMRCRRAPRSSMSTTPLGTRPRSTPSPAGSPGSPRAPS